MNKETKIKLRYQYLFVYLQFQTVSITRSWILQNIDRPV